MNTTFGDFQGINKIVTSKKLMLCYKQTTLRLRDCWASYYMIKKHLKKKTDQSTTVKLKFRNNLQIKSASD